MPLQEEYGRFGKWCHFAKNGPYPQITSEPTLFRVAKDWADWFGSLEPPERECVERRFRSEQADPPGQATLEEQRCFEEWVDTLGTGNPDLAVSQEARRLLLTQLAFLPPFLGWCSPKMAAARSSGLTGVNLGSEQAGEWSPDDLVRWSTYCVEPKVAGGGDQKIRAIGVDVPPADLEVVRDAVLGIFAGSGASAIFWHWFWRGPWSGVPGTRVFHFRHPVCGLMILAFLGCGLALGPFGHLLSQEGITALAKTILFGVPLLGFAILVGWIMEWRRMQIAGKLLEEMMSQRVLCGHCGRQTTGCTTPKGYSYRLPFGLSAVFAVLQQADRTDAMVHKSLWGELWLQIKERRDGICVSGGLQKSGPVDAVDRLEDKFKVALHHAVPWFFAPKQPLPEVPGGLRVLQAKCLTDAVLYMTRQRARWWRGWPLRWLCLGVLLLGFAFGVNDLRWMAFPERGPAKYAAYVLRGSDDIFGSEQQALRVEFPLGVPHRWLFSLHSGLAWTPVVRFPLAIHANNKKRGVGYAEVPACFNGMVVRPTAVLERQQQFLLWTLPPSRPSIFLFPLSEIRRL